MMGQLQCIKPHRRKNQTFAQLGATGGNWGHPGFQTHLNTDGFEFWGANNYSYS